ncbi:MAG: hypothetical protein JSR41_14705 [Proteobacteria bacterium]|nr:hypothetical protein [Pseudomonadota bacterium]
MRVISFAGTLVFASVALVACGGGDGDFTLPALAAGGDSAGSAKAEQDSAMRDLAQVAQAGDAQPQATVAIAADAGEKAWNVATRFRRPPRGGATTFDAANYRAVAAAMGTAAGIDYRYGPAPSAYGTGGNDGLPTWSKRPDIAYVSDRNGGQRGCDPAYCGTWQVGAWSNDVGGYSSNVGHVAYLPDVPAQRLGVADLAISSMSNGVFSQRPELMWVYYGGGVDEISGIAYRQAGAAVGNPVSVARCPGRPGWCMNSLMVFDTGFIGSAQSNTSTNKASAQLAAGKVPTAIAITNSNEFALITVWDTVNLRGEVAVVALAGLCEGCTPANPASSSSWWGEWNGLYPGLPNLGNTAYMKVLGYIPLPAEMKAPTDISVTTGVSREAYLSAGAPGQESTYDLPLSSATNRATFKSGGRNYDRYAKAGIAVVASKSEQKVAFLDLRPLFAYYQRMYFGSDADYGVTTSVGPADSQWPRTFVAAPEQTPTVIKTVAMGNRPTAVKTYAWGTNRRAWVATQEGLLHIFNLGDYPTAGTGSAGSIVEVGTVAVGRNPTGIALVKEKAGNALYPDITREVIVTSRGDRQLQWVRFAGNGNSGSVVRTLRDSRLVDPISAEDTDNNGTESYVVSVADYGGRALRNYRYGPVIMHNYPGSACGAPSGCGMGSNSADPFEYGGEFGLPGGPFQVMSANIP